MGCACVVRVLRVCSAWVVSGLRVGCEWFVSGLRAGCACGLLQVLTDLLLGSHVGPEAFAAEYDMWAGGHVVYGMCIMMANICLLLMQNNWIPWLSALLFGQWLIYYPTLAIDSTSFDTNVIYSFYS